MKIYQIPITRLSSHYPYGMYFEKQQDTGNLKKSLDLYHSDISYRDNINSSVSVINNHPIFVQCFYYIFNLYNYRSNLTTYQVYNNSIILNPNHIQKNQLNENVIVLKEVDSHPFFFYSMFIKFFSMLGFTYFISLNRSDYFYSLHSNIPKHSKEIDNHERLQLGIMAQKYQEKIEALRTKEINDSLLSNLKILDIQKNIGDNITLDDIHKAYKNIALRKHPDRPSGAHDKFILIKMAKEALEKCFDTSAIDECQANLNQIERIINLDDNNSQIKKDIAGMKDQLESQAERLNKIKYALNKQPTINDSSIFNPETNTPEESNRSSNSFEK